MSRHNYAMWYFGRIVTYNNHHTMISRPRNLSSKYRPRFLVIFLMTDIGLTTTWITSVRNTLFLSLDWATVIQRNILVHFGGKHFFFLPVWLESRIHHGWNQPRKSRSEGGGVGRGYTRNSCTLHLPSPPTCSIPVSGYIQGGPERMQYLRSIISGKRGTEWNSCVHYCV